MCAPKVVLGCKSVPTARTKIFFKYVEEDYKYGVQYWYFENITTKVMRGFVEEVMNDFFYTYYTQCQSFSRCVCVQQSYTHSCTKKQTYIISNILFKRRGVCFIYFKPLLHLHLHLPIQHCLVNLHLNHHHLLLLDVLLPPF